MGGKAKISEFTKLLFNEVFRVKLTYIWQLVGELSNYTCREIPRVFILLAIPSCFHGKAMTSYPATSSSILFGGAKNSSSSQIQVGQIGQTSKIRKKTILSDTRYFPGQTNQIKPKVGSKILFLDLKFGKNKKKFMTITGCFSSNKNLQLYNYFPPSHARQHHSHRCRNEAQKPQILSYTSISKHHSPRIRGTQLLAVETKQMLNVHHYRWTQFIPFPIFFFPFSFFFYC